MSRLRIPEQYVSGIAAIRQQEEAAMRAFSAALSTVSPSLNAGALISTISSSVTSIPQSDIEKMVAAVVSLYAGLDSSDFPLEVFIEEICKAMAESKHKDLNFEGEADRERFKSRLIYLLNIESFSLASRALSLKSEYANVFCNGRIMTDARPVYGTDVSTAPHAALILHSLKLSYHQSTTDVQEFYVTLDDSDLMELKDLLDRAELKSKSLTAALKAAGINVITTNNE
jgi:hypothetical protein